MLMQHHSRVPGGGNVVLVGGRAASPQPYANSGQGERVLQGEGGVEQREDQQQPLPQDPIIRVGACSWTWRPSRLHLLNKGIAGL